MKHVGSRKMDDEDQHQDGPTQQLDDSTPFGMVLTVRGLTTSFYHAPHRSQRDLLIGVCCLAALYFTGQPKWILIIWIVVVASLIACVVLDWLNTYLDELEKK